VTYTDPEIAHVGLTEQQAREKYGDKVKVYHFSMAEGDRSVAEDDRRGFIKLVYRGSGDLLGATVVAQRAGEMIFELDLAVQDKLSLTQITGMIHAYPTYSDVVKKAISNLVIDELFQGVSGRAIGLLRQTLYS
jgi:pyruvate/2-oxoglutarate dehydrogenase complex dihydrolipoamide dehydrogenase (E3) component